MLLYLKKLSFDLNQANCLDADPEIFFVDDREEPEYDKWKTNSALRLCSSCPVKADCLKFALKEKAIGVWGGTTTLQRRVIANRSARGLVDRKARKDNTQYLDGANLAKSIEKGAKIAEDLTKALAVDNGWADDMTIVLARMKIRNPAMSYTEMALATGLSRDVVSGRIQRLIRRNNERVS